MMIRGKGNMKKWFMLVVLVFVMVVAGEVWGIRAASAAAKSVKLRAALASEPAPDQLSPIMGRSVDALVTSSVMEPLVDVGKGGEPVPKLATKWEQRGPTTWRFYLRKGVKFHNGADFTARDVVDNVKWLLDEKKVSLVYQRIPIQKAVAEDDYTVDLIFEQPQPFMLLEIRQLQIVPLAISRDNRKMAEIHPIGTGPYRFVEWKKGLTIKLAKFEGYWGPRPQIDDVEIIFRAEEAVRLAALIAGEVDWVYGLSSEQASRAPKIVRMPSPETVWLQIDEYIQKEQGGMSILADKRLRLALEYAIDRQALVALYQGFATPSLGQFASPGDFGFNPHLKSRPYDLEKAKALVREAGAVGKTVSFVSPTDRYVKDREVAEAIAFMIEKTGLKVKILFLPQSELRKYGRVTTPEERKNKADLVIGPSDALLEVETRFGIFFVEGGRNNASLDPEPTRLYKEVQTESDYAKRGEKLGNAWAYVYEQAHYVPLFKLEWIWGLAKNLEWKPDIAGRTFVADMKFID